MIPIKAMGNNPDLWPEPERFLPFDRWASDEVCQTVFFVFPFSALLVSPHPDRRATAKRSTRSCGCPSALVPATGTCPGLAPRLNYITRSGISPPYKYNARTHSIGQRFAIIEAKLVLAHVLRRFRLQLSPGQVPLELDPGITTSPKHGIKVTLHRR